MNHRQRSKRGEGHVEYVIITGVIMVCSVVALFAIWGDLGAMIRGLRLCGDCDEQALHDTIDPKTGLPRPKTGATSGATSGATGPLANLGTPGSAVLGTEAPGTSLNDPLLGPYDPNDPNRLLLDDDPVAGSTTTTSDSSSSLLGSTASWLLGAQHMYDVWNWFWDLF